MLTRATGVIRMFQAVGRHATREDDSHYKWKSGRCDGPRSGEPERSAQQG